MCGFFFLNFKVVKFMFFLLAIMTARNILGKIKYKRKPTVRLSQVLPCL